MKFPEKIPKEKITGVEKSFATGSFLYVSKYITNKTLHTLTKMHIFLCRKNVCFVEFYHFIQKSLCSKDFLCYNSAKQIQFFAKYKQKADKQEPARHTAKALGIAGSFSFEERGQV